MTDVFWSTDPAWCAPDDCPTSICGGPHWEHVCPEQHGDRVTARVDMACPWCGTGLDVDG